MKPLPVSKWQTFVPEATLDIKPTQTTPSRKMTLKLTHVNQSKVKSVNDTTFMSMNQATVNLMKQTASNPEPLLRLHQQDQQNKAASKSEKKKRTIAAADDEGVDEEDIRDDYVHVNNADEDEEDRIQKTVRAQKRHVPPAGPMQTLPVEDLEQHTKRDDQLALFALNMSRYDRPTTDVIVNTPPSNTVLAYCAKHKDKFPWFTPMQAFVASSELYDYPDVQVVSREAILPFLREPNPRAGYERPCVNLDREPYEREGKVRCIWHRISEERLGKGKGYRLREFIIGAANAYINEAIEHKQDPRVHLTSSPEMCYLCHLWMYLGDCTNQRDKADERMRRDMTEEGEDDTVVIINKFMVIVDQPGEYDSRKMLAADKVSAGIWGPVPLFNEGNYTHTVQGGLRHVIESDNLLFRLTRASQPRTDSLSAQKSSSVQSNHFFAVPAALNSQH